MFQLNVQTSKLAPESMDIFPLLFDPNDEWVAEFKSACPRLQIYCFECQIPSISVTAILQPSIWNGQGHVQSNRTHKKKSEYLTSHKFMPLCQSIKTVIKCETVCSMSRFFARYSFCARKYPFP